MKIVFVISEMTAGGAERQAALICNHWAQAGHSVTLVTLRGLGSHYPLHPAIVRREEKGSLRDFLRGAGPDVVVSFMDTVNVKTLLAAWGLDIPVIVSERSIPAALFEMNGLVRGMLYGVLRRLLYRRAAALVVQTRAAAAWGRRITSRVEIIPNVVATQTDSDLAVRGTTVLAVGRLTWEKGHALLLQAFASVADRFPDWRLTLHGEGPLRADLERMAAELGIAGRVALPGIKRDLAQDYAGAGLFVLPSLFEGFPNALIEAMQAGCTVIASDCPVAPREIITDGQDGFLFRKGDASALAQMMATAMEDVILRRRLGEAAAQSALRYRPDRVLPLWDALLAGAGRPHPRPA